MAKGIPDAIAMREVKFGAKTQPAQQVAFAKTLLEAGRVAEALDLLLLAGDEKGIATIRKRACTDGRPVWLIMIEHSMVEGGGQSISAAEWTECGEAALRAERWREAFRAFTMAGDEANLTRVQEKIPNYEIYVPQGK